MTSNAHYFNSLAHEVGVELKHLPLLISALKVDTDRLFPLLSKAISLNNFGIMYYYTDALKGIIGNMHLYDIYEIITRIDCATKAKDETFLYETNFLILKEEIEILIKNFYTYLDEE
ncbi:MAG: hypothetical protein ACYDD5_11755 [Sulfuricurvum sp.]